MTNYISNIISPNFSVIHYRQSFEVYCDTDYLLTVEFLIKNHQQIFIIQQYIFNQRSQRFLPHLGFWFDLQIWEHFLLQADKISQFSYPYLKGNLSVVDKILTSTIKKSS